MDPGKLKELHDEGGVVVPSGPGEPEWTDRPEGYEPPVQDSV